MIYSTLGKGMNFSNLSVEGYSAFILALFFSIVSVASFIYFMKHKETTNTVLTVLITLVFPMLTVFFWSYMMFNLYEYEIALALGISFGIALGYGLVALCIALIANAVAKAKANKKEEPQEEATLVAPETMETEAEPVEMEQKLLNAPETEEVAEEEQPVEETTEEQPEEKVEEEVTPETVVEENIEAEQTVEAESTEPEVVEQGVVFSNGPRKTFAEQLEALSDEIKGYYNEILEYAMSKPDAKCSNAKYHTTVKIFAMKLLDAKFAKEVLVCNFMAGSSELKNYSKKEKVVKIKEKPVIIEIDSAESVTVAKNMIDIVYKNIEDAKEERVEEKKAKRRKPKKVEENAEESAPATEETQPVEENETPATTEESSTENE